MKKAISVLVGAVMLFALSVCQSEQSTTINSAASSQATSDKSSVLVLTAMSSAASSEAPVPTDEDTPKILVAYFSRTGNTETIAKMIIQTTGGASFQIETTEPYPEDYTKTTEVAKQEQADKARPALSAQVENMANYDTVFIGFPIWWGTPPMAVFTFLEEYDFAGKTIVPFCTHEGSGMGDSASALVIAAPDATILEGLAVSGDSAVNAGDNVAAWLDSLAYGIN